MAKEVMTYKQFVAKHKASGTWMELPDSEKRKRYEDYLSSGPNPKWYVNNPAAAAGAQKVKLSTGPNGGTRIGKSAASAIAKQYGLKMSPQTHQYLTALSNPFCPRLQNVGYPMSGGVPSYKFRAFARGQMVLGVNGTGYIMADPVAAVAVDIPAVSYSDTALYPGGAAFPGSAAGVGQANVPINSPVATTTTLASSTAYRLVAMGIRIRSEVALLEKAGSCISTLNPLQNSDLFGVTSQQALTDFWKTTKWTPLNTADSAWHSVLWSATMPNGPVAGPAPSFGGSAATIYQTLASAPSTEGNYSIGILVVGGQAGQVYDFEVVGFYELFGGNLLVQISATPTYSDPTGVATIEASTQNVSINAMSKNEEGAVTAKSILSSVGNAVSNMSTIGQQVTNAINSAVPNVGSTTSTLQDLEARLAGLKMPSVPTGGVTSSVVDFGEEALEGIGEAAAIFI